MMEELRPAKVTLQEGYTSWTAVAGFFDGDGSVDVDARAYTLHWVISFTDKWFEQVEQVREFLIERGVRVGRTRRVGVGGWICEVKEISSLRAVAIQMLQSGGIYKKRRELQLLVDYYSDKITAAQILEAFNSEVRLGIRVGKIRNTDMPFSYSEGLAQAQYASRFERRALTKIESQSLVEEYLSKNVTGKWLARKYDVSEATVSKLLRRAGISRTSGARTPTGSPDSARNL